MLTLWKRGSGWAATVSLLLAAAGAGADGGDAGVIHACVQHSTGRARIVAPSESCERSETALSWNRTGPPGPAGPAGAPGPAGPPGGAYLQVVDAAGRVVGPVVALDYLTPIVGVKVPGLVFTLRLEGGALVGYDYVYFPSTDCSPPGYVSRYRADLPATAVDHALRVYLDDFQGTEGVLVAGSYAARGVCYPNLRFSVWVVPAAMVGDIGSHFVGPFRVQ